MDLFREIRGIFSRKEKTLFEAENNLWNEITTLENSLKQTKTDSERTIILQKIEQKKAQIRELIDKNPAKLKYRIKELQDELKRINEVNLEARGLVRYYEEVIRHYEDELEQEKTADNLKELVKYDCTEIDILVDSLKPNMYSYEKDYLDAISGLFNYIKDNFYLITKKMNIKFWLESTAIIKTRSGDPLDVAIFVCATMHALGDYSARIYFVELDDFSTFAFVKTKYKNRVLIFDPFNAEKYDDYLGYDAAISEKYKPFGKGIKKTIYSFNAFEFNSE